jgi:hypothetical protein
MLIDSDILVDVLRRHPSATSWFASLDERPAISGFSAFELVAGCRDAVQLRHAKRFLSSFQVVWPDATGMEAMLGSFGSLRLSHSLGIIDALIAATALDRGLLLASFNTKHYTGISDLQLVQPYAR